MNWGALPLQLLYLLIFLSSAWKCYIKSLKFTVNWPFNRKMNYSRNGWHYFLEQTNKRKKNTKFKIKKLKKLLIWSWLLLTLLLLLLLYCFIAIDRYAIFIIIVQFLYFFISYLFFKAYSFLYTLRSIIFILTN